MSGTGKLGVSFVIPTLNAAGDGLLDRCLRSICAQRFPADGVEVLVVDGGSTDATRAIAEGFGATIVDNPLKRAEPGVKLGFARAHQEVRVVMAADNALPVQDWLERVVGVFERTGVRGAYTHVVDAKDDPPACRWFNGLHADPYNWFVHGARAVHPARFADLYPVEDQGEGYVVCDLRHGPRPLLALAQGFALRGELPDGEHEEDDIAPLWDMIEHGERFAYVDVGVHHRTVRGLRDFHGKYHRRTASALASPTTPYRARSARLSRNQRVRQALWPLYAASLVGPLTDAVRGWRRTRNAAWLLHPVGCLVLLAAMARAALEERDLTQHQHRLRRRPL